MGVANLWVATRDGKKKWPITKNTVSTLGTFIGYITPDDKNVVFQSNLNLSGKWDDIANTGANIWVIDREGKNPPRAVTQSSVAGVNSYVNAISSDGRSILVRSNLNLSGKFEDLPNLSYNIWSIGIDGSNLNSLTKNTKKLLDSSGGVYFPNGSRVAFISKTALTGIWDSTANPVWTIWTIALDGSDLKLVAGSAKMGFYFSAISSDSSTIYGASPRSFDGISADLPSANIWAIKVDGSGMVPLTFNTKAKLNSYSPRLSPSCKELIYISMNDLSGVWDGQSSASFNIWRMNIDGSELVPLTQNSGGQIDANMDMPVEWAPSVKCK